MAPEVPNISYVNGEIVTRLPLNIERLIHRVGQLVGAVVVPKREERDPG